jgi:hypothetical protein
MPDPDPPRFDGVDKRKHERYDVSLPVTFVCDMTHATHRGTIKNVGMGGMLLETIARLTKMERITLSVPAGEEGYAKIGAVVVRFHIDSAYGVAFLALSRDDQVRVRTLIDKHLARLGGAELG